MLEVPREGVVTGAAVADGDVIERGAIVGREEEEEEAVAVVDWRAGFFDVLVCFKELSERRLEISCDCV